jgi:hypothetical protein
MSDVTEAFEDLALFPVISKKMSHLENWKS